MSKHNLEVVLVVASPNLTSPGNSQLLFIEREDGTLQLPTAEVGEQESTLAVAARVLKETTGLEARVMGVGWVDMQAFPLADDVGRLKTLEDSYDGEDRSRSERWIAVPYGAMLPGEIVRLRHPRAKWVALHEVFGQELYMDHTAILQAVCSRL